MKRIPLITCFLPLGQIKQGDEINVHISSVQLVTRIDKIVIDGDEYECHRTINVGEMNVIINVNAKRDYKTHKADCTGVAVNGFINLSVPVIIGAELVGAKVEDTVYLSPKKTSIVCIAHSESMNVRGIFLEEADSIDCKTCENTKRIGRIPYDIDCPMCPATLDDIEISDIKVGKDSEYINGNSISPRSAKYYESTKSVWVGQFLSIHFTNNSNKGLRIKGYICYEKAVIPPTSEPDIESSEKINPIDPNMRMTPYRN